jgi:hypothetical protein
MSSELGSGDADFLGRKGEKCLSINMGPSVLVRKVSRASSALICDGAFSGNKIPGTMNASCSGDAEG